MADVAYNSAVAEEFEGVTSVDTDALTHSGADPYTLAGVQWNDNDGDLTTIKLGGPSGTDLSPISGATIDQAGSGNANPQKGRLYGAGLGATGDNKVYLTFGASANGSVEAAALNNTSGPRSGSGFGIGNAQGFSSGDSNRTITLTKDSIPSAAEDMLIYFGGAQASNGLVPISSITSSTGTLCANSTLDNNYEGAVFRELNDDGSSETAVMQFVAPTYQSGGYWYIPALTAVMTGVSMQSAGGGGGGPGPETSLSSAAATMTHDGWSALSIHAEVAE